MLGLGLYFRRTFREAFRVTVLRHTKPLAASNYVTDRLHCPVISSAMQGGWGRSAGLVNTPSRYCGAVGSPGVSGQSSKQALLAILYCGPDTAAAAAVAQKCSGGVAWAPVGWVAASVILISRSACRHG